MILDSFAILFVCLIGESFRESEDKHITFGVAFIIVMTLPVRCQYHRGSGRDFRSNLVWNKSSSTSWKIKLYDMYLTH